MNNIEFHKRKMENNIRSIKLMYKKGCVKTIDFSEYQLFRILLDIGKMLNRGDSKETISDYVLPYINLHSFKEEISLDDLIPDNMEEMGKYKELLKQKEKANSRQALTIKKLTQKNEELETQKSEVEELITENKKSLDLLKEKDRAIMEQSKVTEKLEKENENLKSQKSELDALVKEKEKIIKSLEIKTKPKTTAKKATRGRGKTKRPVNDVDIDEILEEGLGSK